MTKRALSALLGIVIAVSALAGGCSGPAAVSGNQVSVHYTGTLNDGSEFDSSRGGEPLTFTLGAGQMIPGFDRAVLGMRKGETRTVTIPYAEAYGPRSDDLVFETTRDEFPDGADLRLGSQLVMTDSSGRGRLATVTEVSGDNITLDANHFLAGEDLTFEITLVGIK